jgi:hypothetical protein
MEFKDNSSPGMGVIHKVLLDDNEAVLHYLGASMYNKAEAGQIRKT